MRFFACISTRRQLTNRYLRYLHQHDHGTSMKNNVQICARGHGNERALSPTATLATDGRSFSSSSSSLTATPSLPIPSSWSLQFKPLSSSISPMKSLYPRHPSAIRTMVMVTKTSSKTLQDEVQPQRHPQPQERDDSENNDSQPPNATNSDLIITKSCANRIKQLASSRPNPSAVYLRVFVDAGGCSGFQYKFLLLAEDGSHLQKRNHSNSGDTDEEEEEDGTIDPEEDVVFTHPDDSDSENPARVVIDVTSLDLLRGSTIDYVQEMIRSSFAVVGNPQSESACGCGSSFAVKNFEANPALD
mmetsp:Transcript_21941/g.45909  ORF Transcript_21941/g.45909 Transcript_21941/m.45909 type:complete len:302 (-) Transcript_21941:301-1206(-)